MSSEHEALPPELARLLTLDDGNDGHGPAAPLPHAEGEALIARTLDAWQGGLHAGLDGEADHQLSAAPPPPASLAARRRRMSPWLVGAGLLLTGSVAAYFTGGLGGRDAPTKASQQGGQAPSQAPAQPAEADATAPAASTEEANDLLAEANGLRGRGAYRQAAARYLRVAQGHADTPVRNVARIAAADLLLEQLGDPEAALALYRAALVQPGPLAQEARAGRDRALRALANATPGD